MFLSDLSIKQPVLATMMMVALAVLGITSYRQLNVDQFPNVEFPVVTVTTPYPGASPETVEREVTKKIEEAINTVQGIKHVESTSQEGLSNIVIVFRLEVSTQVASQDIRGKVAGIRAISPGTSTSRSFNASTRTLSPSSRWRWAPPVSLRKPPPTWPTRSSRGVSRTWPASEP